jgi:hypothetical protein
MFGKDRMKTDIGNFWSSGDMWYIVTAVLIIDVIGIFLFRYYPKFFGIFLNEWYSKFGLIASISDIAIIIIGFIIGRLIYTFFLQKTYGWNPVLFIALLLFVQLIHDILFYLFVILPIPEGRNQVIDLFKKYANEIHYNIYIGDAIMVISSAAIAMALKNYGDSITASSAVAAIYALTYILFTKPV